jgi:hypothetical protein
MSAKPQTPQPGWEYYPNLRRRLYAPARGRGRLQRQIARCFAVFGPEVSSSRLLDWCYTRDPRRRHRWSVVRILRQIADPIGRAPTIGRPWIWRIKTSGADQLSATKD